MNYTDKFKIETFFTIDYSDLDEIIYSEYGESDFTCAFGISNDSIDEFIVDGDYDEEDLMKFINNREFDEYLTTQNLLNHLCSEGKIEAGKYLINISW